VDKSENRAGAFLPGSSDAVKKIFPTPCIAGDRAALPLEGAMNFFASAFGRTLRDRAR
jgi:hypothetical protein